MLKENKVKELGEALKLIFSKVAGFFDIFDLSFFVSGITSAAAMAAFLHLAGVTVTTILASKGSGSPSAVCAWTPATLDLPVRSSPVTSA